MSTIGNQVVGFDELENTSSDVRVCLHAKAAAPATVAAATRDSRRRRFCLFDSQRAPKCSLALSHNGQWRDSSSSSGVVIRLLLLPLRTPLSLPPRLPPRLPPLGTQKELLTCWLLVIRERIFYESIFSPTNHINITSIRKREKRKQLKLFSSLSKLLLLQEPTSQDTELIVPIYCIS